MARTKYTVTFPAAKAGDEVTWPNTVKVYADANIDRPMGNGYIEAAAGSFTGWSDASSVTFTRAGTDAVTVTAASPTGTGAAVPTAAYSPLHKYAPVGLSALARVKHAIKAGVSTGITICEDSTAYTSGTTRWPYPFAAALATQLAATHAVQMLQWDSGSGLYGQPVAYGGSTPQARVATFTGAGGLYSWGERAAITADCDIRIKASYTAWPPAAGIALLNRWTGLSGGSAWSLTLDTLGRMLFQITAGGDPAVKQFAYSSVITATVNVPIWLRVTYVKSTGVMSFFYAADTGSEATPSSWTAAGTTTVTANTAIYDPGATAPITLGTDQDNLSDFMPNGTKVYEVAVRNGVNGPSTVPRYPDNWADVRDAGGSVTYSGKPVFTILNGGSPGAAASYFTNATTLAQMVDAAYCSDAVIVCDSHNELVTTTGAAWLTILDNWLAQVKTLTTRAPVIWMTQNPKGSPAQKIAAHAQRNREIAGWAARNNVTLIDVFAAFVDDVAAGNHTLAALLEGDGIHPSDAAGSPLWATVVGGVVSAALNG